MLVAKPLKLFLKIFKCCALLVLRENVNNLHLFDYKQSMECDMKNILLDVECSGFEEWLWPSSCVTLAN